MNYFEGLRVHLFNHTPESPQHVDDTLKNFVLSYVHSGQIYWQPEKESPRQLESPLVFFTWPGPRWRYGPVHSHWNNRYISFNRPRLKAFIRSGLFPQIEPAYSPRPIYDPVSFCREYDKVLDLLAVESPDSPSVVHAVEGLLLKVHQQPNTYLPNSGPAARIFKLIKAIQADSSRPWDFSEEAKRIGCTPTHFRRLWKQQTGRSPVESLQKHRMDQAASLLRKGELPIEQIAWQCGFEHSSYFYRLFQKSYGMAPGQYRKRFSRIG